MSEIEMIDKVDKLAGSFSEIIKLLYATTQELVNKNGFQYTEVLVGLYFVTKIHREAAYNHLMKLKTTEKEAALQGLSIELYLDNIQEEPEKIAEGYEFLPREGE